MVRSLPWLSQASSSGFRQSHAVDAKRRRVAHECSDEVRAQDVGCNKGRKVKHGMKFFCRSHSG